VEVAGLTLRVASIVAMPDWTIPSDQVSVNGGVPESVAWSVMGLPAQIVPPPETVADGAGARERTCVELAVQPLGSATVTPRVTLAPVGVNVTDGPDVLPAIVPPAIVHA
jgi:hypothetical protein